MGSSNKRLNKVDLLPMNVAGAAGMLYLTPHMALHGKFIVFEGGEGSGKSTQANLLKEALELDGTKVLLVRDPGTTRIGEMIRAILLNPENTEMGMRCEMLLYMAARSQMMKEIIQPALDRGDVVISDRFVSSTLAYQLGGDGLTAGEIRAVGQVAINGRWPDRVIILDMPADESHARVKRDKDRIEQRPMEYHRKVRENYLAQAKFDPKTFRVVDAHRESNVVAADVWKAVNDIH